MTILQLAVVTLFGAVVFANTFLMQPGVDLPPELRAALVAADATAFFVALNLRQFADLGKPSAPTILIPPAPAGEPEEAIVVATTVAPHATTAQTTVESKPVVTP